MPRWAPPHRRCRLDPLRPRGPARRRQPESPGRRTRPACSCSESRPRERGLRVLEVRGTRILRGSLEVEAEAGALHFVPDLQGSTSTRTPLARLQLHGARTLTEGWLRLREGQRCRLYRLLDPPARAAELLEAIGAAAPPPQSLSAWTTEGSDLVEAQSLSLLSPRGESLDLGPCKVTATGAGLLLALLAGGSTSRHHPTRDLIGPTAKDTPSGYPWRSWRGPAGACSLAVGLPGAFDQRQDLDTPCAPGELQFGDQEPPTAGRPLPSGAQIWLPRCPIVDIGAAGSCTVRLPTGRTARCRTMIVRLTPGRGGTRMGLRFCVAHPAIARETERLRELHEQDPLSASSASRADSRADEGNQGTGRVTLRVSASGRVRPPR